MRLKSRAKQLKLLRSIRQRGAPVGIITYEQLVLLAIRKRMSSEKIYTLSDHIVGNRILNHPKWKY